MRTYMLSAAESNRHPRVKRSCGKRRFVVGVGGLTDWCPCSQSEDVGGVQPADMGWPQSVKITLGKFEDHVHYQSGVKSRP